MAKFYSQDLCTKWQNFIPRTFVLNREKLDYKKTEDEKKKKKKMKRKMEKSKNQKSPKTFGDLKKV